MRFFSIFIGISWLAVLPLLGQEEGKPKKSEVWLRFTTFGFDSRKLEAVIASGEKISNPFDIRGNGFSEVVTLPSKERAVSLGTPLKEEGEEELSIRPLVQFQLPETGKRFLVILIPKTAQDLRAIVIRGDGEGFGPGEIQFFNLSNEEFGADLDGKRFTIAKNGRKVFKPVQSDKNKPNYQVKLFSIEEGKPRNFAATLWPYLDRKRAYVFLYRDPKSKRPIYRSVDEFTGWM